MAENQTTESPWENHVIVGWETDATPFRLDPSEATKHTLIIGSTAQGMSCLTGMDAATKHAKKDAEHE